MVEGPGCKVKGEVMKKKIQHENVVNVSGPCVEKKYVQNDDGSVSNFHRLIGSKVSDVRTVGKELFIFFLGSELCLRIHFLMDGSVRYMKEASQFKILANPVLVLELTSNIMTVYKSSICLRPSDETTAYCNQLIDLDICAPLFNFKRACELIQAQPSGLICDVIMDQSILPGVGNIIKNEALFNSGINPNSLVSDLTPLLVSRLVHRLRDFSSIFYMCRKEGKPLQRYLRIYKKEKCPECKNCVVTCKIGLLARLSFFCQHCQRNSVQSSNYVVPKQNSLLAFLCCGKENPSSLCEVDNSTGNKTNGEPWQCDTCTLINIASATICEACLKVKPSAVSKKRKLSEADIEAVKDGVKRVRNTANIPSISVHQKFKQRIPPPPSCTQHNIKCVMRKVHRAGENKGRVFFTCSLKQEKKCNFFQWADLNHPRCDHDKVTILQRVLKLNVNNGRQFYCCPLPKGQQCAFFKWADMSEV